MTCKGDQVMWNGGKWKVARICLLYNFQGFLVLPRSHEGRQGGSLNEASKAGAAIPEFCHSELNVQVCGVFCPAGMFPRASGISRIRYYNLDNYIKSVQCANYSFERRNRGTFQSRTDLCA